MDDLAKLVAVEAIRKTKATYWYALDMKDWALFESLFTEDTIIDMREEAYFAQGKPVPALSSTHEAAAAGEAGITIGRQAFVARLAQALSTWRTVHHGHAPIIDIDSADEARAIWPLFDYIDDGTRVLKGYGHYHDSYRRQSDGRWLISSMRLSRLRGDGTHPILGTRVHAEDSASLARD